MGAHGNAVIVTAEPAEHLAATRAKTGYGGNAIVDPDNVLAAELKRRGLLNVAISEKAGYSHGMAQPAVLVIQRDGTPLDQWAIVPSIVSSFPWSRSGLWVCIVVGFTDGCDVRIDESQWRKGPSGSERDLGECRGEDARETAGASEVFVAETRDGYMAGGDGKMTSLWIALLEMTCLFSLRGCFQSLQSIFCSLVFWKKS